MAANREAPVFGARSYSEELVIAGQSPLSIAASLLSALLSFSVAVDTNPEVENSWMSNCDRLSTIGLFDTYYVCARV